MVEDYLREFAQKIELKHLIIKRVMQEKKMLYNKTPYNYKG